MHKRSRIKALFFAAAATLALFVWSAAPSALAQEAATITGRVTNAQGQPEAPIAAAADLDGDGRADLAVTEGFREAGPGSSGQTQRSLGVPPQENILVGLARGPGNFSASNGRTDARGAVQFGQVSPGRYRIYVDTATLRTPVRVHVAIPGSALRISDRIMPTRGGGRAYVSMMGRAAALFDLDQSAVAGPITITVVNDALLRAR